MDGNKISRMYIIYKCFERTNKKVTLQQTILKVVKEKSKEIQRHKTLPYNTIQLFVKSFEIRWKEYRYKNYFYRHSSTSLDDDEELIEKNSKYIYIILTNIKINVH